MLDVPDTSDRSHPDGRPGVFACVVDSDPRFHLETLRWYASLTRVAGVDPEELIVNAVDGNGSRTLEWLRGQGVSVRAIGRFDAGKPHTNNIAGALSLAATGVEGMAVLTDTDIAICEDLRASPVPASAVGFKIVDAENPLLRLSGFPAVDQRIRIVNDAISDVYGLVLGPNVDAPFLAEANG